MGRILSGEVYFERERRVREMKLSLAASPETTPETLDRLARSGIDSAIGDRLCRNPRTSPLTLAYLASRRYVRPASLLRNPSTPDATVEKIARHGSWFERYWANREIRRRNAARRSNQ